MNKVHVILGICLVLFVSFLSGIGGGYLFEMHMVPSMYKNTLEREGLSSSDRPIIQPETIRTKIFESSITDVAEQVSPAVVSVVVTKDLTLYYRDPFEFFYNDPFFYSPQRPESAPESRQETRRVGGGTGFIISQDGMIITNKHVVSDEEAEYTVILNDGREVPVEVITKDPVYDIAVLKIQQTEGEEIKDLPTVKLGDSDNLKVGQMVVAIGNALAEYENTVTTGVISAKNRSIVASNSFGQGERLSNLLQTDAAINPGNSGGPLVNLDGEVIGINTAMATQAQGIGFAIPVNQVTQVLPSIEKYGKIVHPFIGVNYQMLSPGLAETLELPVEEGAYLQDDVENGVRAIVPNSPASNAGLQSGDIIIKVNDTPITTNNELRDVVLGFAPGDTIAVTLMRGGTELTVDITLGERPGEDSLLSQGNVYLGVNTTEVTLEKAELFDLPVSYGALIENNISRGVRGVEKGSPAETAGLTVGDIIVAVNDLSLENMSLTEALSNFGAGETVTLSIYRDKKVQSIEVTLESK